MKALFAVLALALVLRVGLVVATPDFAPFGDPVDYDRIAVSLSELGSFAPTGLADPGGPSALRPPAYPLLLAATYAVTGQRFTAGRLLGALLGTATVLLVYLLAARLFDRRLALWGAGVAAVAPPLILLNGSLLTESLFTPLVLAVALCVLAHRDRSRWWLAAAAGALLGLAVLTRSNGLVLALPLVIGLAHQAGRARLAAPAIALACTALVLVPWTVRNASAFERFLPTGTQTGYTMAGAWSAQATEGGAGNTFWLIPQTVPVFAGLFGQPDIDEGDLDAELRSRALDFAADNPGAVLAALVTNVPRTFDLGPGHTETTNSANTEMAVPASAAGPLRAGTYGLLLLTLAGALLMPRARGRWWFWLMPVLVHAGVVLWLSSPRYAAPLYAFMAIPCGAALAAAATRLRAARA